MYQDKKLILSFLAAKAKKGSPWARELLHLVKGKKVKGKRKDIDSSRAMLIILKG